ncbi:MAG: hypothetical protein A2X24_02705 [Chloroflexi bacterium GWB2_54_36]|nr:MAG: hypothetical protein A2X24_02705 [Chloroflexi bacterium GWB2_54_36]
MLKQQKWVISPTSKSQNNLPQELLESITGARMHSQTKYSEGLTKLAPFGDSLLSRLIERIKAL